MLLSSPCTGVQLPPENSAEAVFLSPDQIDQPVSAIPPPCWTLVLTASGTACGRGSSPTTRSRPRRWVRVTASLRQRRSGHDPGRVLVDVAVAIADGARTISDVQVLADQRGLHGPVGSVPSTPTIWRVLDGADEQMLSASGRPEPSRGTGRGWPAVSSPELCRAPVDLCPSRSCELSETPQTGGLRDHCC